MTLNISSNFYPYRLLLKRKDPVELKVQVVNTGEKPTMVSLHIALDRNLAFDKGGLKSAIMEKMDSLAPNERKTFTYEVFAKGFAYPGTYPILMKAMEHYQTYRFADKEYTKNFDLVVAD